MITAVVVAIVLLAMAWRSGRGGRMARSGLLYALAGPPLGALPFLAAVLASGDPETLLMAVFVLMFSYVLGVAPALLAGLCMGSLRDRVRSRWRPLLGMAIGATTAGTLGLPLLDHEWQRALPLAGVGGLAALLLELFLLWRGPRPGPLPVDPAAVAS